jgi:hypothetical protein
MGHDCSGGGFRMLIISRIAHAVIVFNRSERTKKVRGTDGSQTLC